MIKKLLLTSAITSTILFATDIDKNDNIYKSIQNVIPTTKIAKYEKAEIDGLYKVFTQRGDLFYVYPFKNLIFFGEIWNKQGYSFTRGDRARFQKKQMQQKKDNINKLIKYDELTKFAIDVRKAKNSKYELVVFTDPLCPFCVKLKEFLVNKQVDIKVNYTFPVKHRFSKELAYSTLMVDEKHRHSFMNQTFKLASNMYEKRKMITKKDVENLNNKYKIDINDKKHRTKATSQLAYMNKIAQKLNIYGTPTILIIDKSKKNIVDMIIGADTKKIKKYLK